MSMIRLVVSDIDGTLVGKDKALSDGNAAAVQRLTQAGVAMTLISARPPSGMRWLGEKLGLPGPFGAFNGGTLFTADGTILEQHLISSAVAHEVLAHLEREPVIRWLFADGLWLATEEDADHCPREVKSANVQPVIGADFGDRINRADKIVAVSDDEALLDRIEQEIRDLVGDQATVARSQTYYLDVTAAAGNKGDGITALAKAFGVALDETVALGDQANDLPMFARAGFSVAMGQGPEKVRAAAKEVAKSNDEDGVADAIDRFILPKVQS
jgi:Cof subfamily protein (haloacid dehalogenase superfamily)